MIASKFAVESKFLILDEAKELQQAFGNHIRELREAKNLSKTAFADLMGKERIDVSQIERGERNVTLRTMLSLAKALEVPIMALLDFDKKLVNIVKPESKKKTAPRKKAAKKTRK